MRTILARLAYDGTDFAGYQIQRRERTVQAELERALAELLGDDGGWYGGREAARFGVEADV